jgi:hypothetical protein
MRAWVALCIDSGGIRRLAAAYGVFKNPAPRFRLVDCPVPFLFPLLRHVSHLSARVSLVTGPNLQGPNPHALTGSSGWAWRFHGAVTALTQPAIDRWERMSRSRGVLESGGVVRQLRIRFQRPWQRGFGVVELELLLGWGLGGCSVALGCG